MPRRRPEDTIRDMERLLSALDIRSGLLLPARTRLSARLETGEPVVAEVLVRGEPIGWRIVMETVQAGLGHHIRDGFTIVRDRQTYRGSRHQPVDYDSCEVASASSPLRAVAELLKALVNARIDDLAQDLDDEAYAEEIEAQREGELP